MKIKANSFYLDTNKIINFTQDINPKAYNAPQIADMQLNNIVKSGTRLAQESEDDNNMFS